MMPSGRRRPGFTLVEITLVIALGTIILAAAMSAFSKWRDQARVNAGKLHLASIQQSAAMIKYRTGKPINLGYAGNAQTVSGTTLTLPAPGPTVDPSNESRSQLPLGSTVCVEGQPYRVIAAPGANVLTVQPSFPPTLSGTPRVRSGLQGNVDDKCEKLVSISDPEGSPVPGMGLSDPWIGYTNVRPIPGANNLPTHDPNRGFIYDPNRNDVWGGLAYFGDNKVEYVLPYPTSTPKPPASIGYFPGDPPKDWGGAR
jgi:prepilin-type N-terminal cleavage/methylation domain-containing protein